MPPTPMPVRKRSSNSHWKSGAKAEATPQIASMTTAIISTGRRPMRSASRPNTNAPISMPTKNMVPVCSAVGTGMPKVAAIDGAVKPIDSTCIASASHTRPNMTNSRYWKRPTPAARMPCSIVIGCDDAARALGWGGEPSAASGMVVVAMDEMDDDMFVYLSRYRLVLELGSTRGATQAGT
ncbi:hypothetical protein CBM2606_A40160 [Cupriavidus taiwanensis]|nr:hypothetical protein CBM2606_A40160 [Cupriavidus taiwanensis]